MREAVGILEMLQPRAEDECPALFERMTALAAVRDGDAWIALQDIDDSLVTETSNQAKVP